MKVVPGTPNSLGADRYKGHLRSAVVWPGTAGTPVSDRQG